MAEEQIQTPPAPAGDAAAAKKNKKVNRLSADDITRKIAELEGKNESKSKYYKHLQARKEEAQKKA
ncbi:MAG: hypothetical protein MUC95_01325 [Spirochaetes bacterium]|jgi:hypothetical protein|nr:hypothetical protein [Spirochaetota bacterium]